MTTLPNGVSAVVSRPAACALALGASLVLLAARARAAGSGCSSGWRDWSCGRSGTRSRCSPRGAIPMCSRCSRGTCGSGGTSHAELA